jgi:hypothetical protein
VRESDPDVQSVKRHGDDRGATDALVLSFEEPVCERWDIRSHNRLEIGPNGKSTKHSGSLED